jgi:hypothetical protein
MVQSSLAMPSSPRGTSAVSSSNAGLAPQVIAAVRNTALALLRRLGFKPVEGFKHFAEYGQAAIDVVFGKRTE